MAKMNPEGNLVTEKAELENLYLKTYIDRLKPNTITPGLELLEEMKEYLFQLRLQLCRERVSKDWTMADLDTVLKQLKNNKARDAHGHTYELFKYGGKYLRFSMLKLFNLVKKTQVYPQILQPANITSLYQQKGSKADLNNDRGIFNVVKLRTILDRLIYNEKYEIIESSMSCSNIGARKHRNIRDHLFVLNAILHEASTDKNIKIDIESFNIIKCFDKMWVSETSNDMYNAGLNDDMFVLVAHSNEACLVAMKTPWG